MFLARKRYLRYRCRLSKSCPISPNQKWALYTGLSVCQELSFASIPKTLEATIGFFEEMLI